MQDQPTAHGPVLSTRLFQKVEAVIPRFCLGDLRDALADHGIEGALVSRVKRFEKAPEEVERYFGNDYLPDFLPQTKIELILPIDLVPAAVKTILRKARIRSPQDRILLSPVLRVISIDAPHGKPARRAAILDGPAKLRADAAQSLR